MEDAFISIQEAYKKLSQEQGIDIEALTRICAHLQIPLIHENTIRSDEMTRRVFMHKVPKTYVIVIRDMGVSSHAMLLKPHKKYARSLCSYERLLEVIECLAKHQNDLNLFELDPIMLPNSEQAKKEKQLRKQSLKSKSMKPTTWLKKFLREGKLSGFHDTYLEDEIISVSLFLAQRPFGRTLDIIPTCIQAAKLLTSLRKSKFPSVWQSLEEEIIVEPYTVKPGVKV